MKKGERKPEVTSETPLTPREIRFLDAWFMTQPPFNGAEAARAVGYAKSGAAVTAVQILIKPNVIAEVNRRRALMDEVSEITKAQWLKSTERFYRANMRKVIDVNGHVLPIPEWGDDEAAMLAGIEVTEEFTMVEREGVKKAEHTGYTKKIKWVDPMKANEYYGKVRGFISDDPLPIDSSLKSLTIVFVNSQGRPVDVNFNPQTRQISRVDEPTRHTPGVTFVSHRG